MTATALRSVLFACTQAIVTPPFAVLALLTFPLPARARYRVITLWSRLTLRLARTLCGVAWRVQGAERLPQTPCVVLANHQSAWETMAFQELLPPQVWVIKKSLLRIPFFGWGLAMLSPIAIDRSAGTRALRQMREQGADRLARGFWVVVFPEGTRAAPGEHRRFHTGGAWLAQQTGAAIVPVAHNAGTLWPRRSFLKRPGTITVSIGAPIPTAGRGAEELTREVEAWIRAEVERLGHAARRAA